MEVSVFLKICLRVNECEERCKEKYIVIKEAILLDRRLEANKVKARSSRLPREL